MKKIFIVIALVAIGFWLGSCQSVQSAPQEVQNPDFSESVAVVQIPEQIPEIHAVSFDTDEVDITGADITEVNVTEINVTEVNITEVNVAEVNISEIEPIFEIIVESPSYFPISSIEVLADNHEIPVVIPCHEPELTFREITLRNMALGKLEFLISWEVENKNDFPLNISKFDYNLSVNNTLWAEETNAEPLRINAKAKTVISQEIIITSVPIIQQVINIMNGGSGLNYNSRGNVYFQGDSPGMERTGSSFDLSGATKLVDSKR